MCSRSNYPKPLHGTVPISLVTSLQSIPSVTSVHRELILERRRIQSRDLHRCRARLPCASGYASCALMSKIARAITKTSDAINVPDGICQWSYFHLLSKIPDARISRIKAEDASKARRGARHFDHNVTVSLSRHFFILILIYVIRYTLYVCSMFTWSVTLRVRVTHVKVSPLAALRFSVMIDERLETRMNRESQESSWSFADDINIVTSRVPSNVHWILKLFRNLSSECAITTSNYSLFPLSREFLVGIQRHDDFASARSLRANGIVRI